MSKKKILSLFIVLFFFIALTLSLDFITVNAEHDCCGEGCEICATLQVADQISGGVKGEETVASSAVCFCGEEDVLILNESESLREETPVQRCDILII